MIVLYVEDNAMDADLTQRYLNTAAPWLHLEIVSTLGEAMERLQQPEAYDLVLTDKRLPDGDGMTLLSYIRERNLPLAVVVITGMGDQQAVVTALRMGADDYIVKTANYIQVLPIALRNALQAYHRRTAEHIRPLRVLYAEHDPSDIDLTRRSLASHAPHLRLDVVLTAQDVLARLDQDNGDQPYDVLLLDYRLPGMNALELIQELRTTRPNVQVPIVLITGQGSEEVALQALKMGVIDYICKTDEYLSRLPIALENAFHRARLTREQAALRAANERLRFTLESITEAYFAIDSQWRLLEANPVAERTLFGRPVVQLLARSLLEDLPALVGSAFHQHLQEVFQKRVPAHVEIPWPESDRWLEVHAYPRDDHIECYIRDISERKRQERTLQAAYQALELRAQQLRALASQLSQVERRERRRLAQVLHDGLQQILAAARMQLGTVRRGLADSTRLQAADEIDDMLGQALKISRSLTVELAPPMLYELGLVAGLEWLGHWIQQQHGLEVHVRAPAEIGAVPEDLRGFLFHAVRELLFNVAKHASVCCAQVVVEALPDSRIQLTVVDEGHGFDPAQLLSANPSGSFGLFSLQERSAAMGGILSIDSRPGQGTRVTLAVPLDVESGASGPDTRPSERTRLLIVDDRAIVRQGIINLMREEQDIEVIGEASNGEEAVRCARELQPDVILMDVNMPIMNGIEATRRLAAELPQIRIVGLSVYEEATLEQAMRAAGAADYVTKSSPPALLLAAVRASALR